MSEWSDERTALVTKLWADGLSASQCAEQLGGVSRNAVIGKVNRLGLQRDAQALLATRQLRNLGTRQARLKAERATKKPRQNHNNLAAINVQSRRKPVPLPTPRPTIDFTNAKPWLERAFGECAFPIGEGADLLSCCAPTERTYCKACEGVMFRPEQPTRKSTMRIARLAA